METESRDNSLNLGYAGGTFPNNGEPMTQGGQSQQEAPEPMKPLLHPKRKKVLRLDGWDEVRVAAVNRKKWRKTADALCTTQGTKETGTGTGTDTGTGTGTGFVQESD